MEHLRSFKASIESFQSTSIEITGGDDRQGAAVARAFCKKLKIINLSDISYYDIIQPKYSHINCTVLFKFDFCVCVCCLRYQNKKMGTRGKGWLPSAKLKKYKMELSVLAATWVRCLHP